MPSGRRCPPAAGHGTATNVMNATRCDPLDYGKSGDKMQPDWPESERMAVSSLPIFHLRPETIFIDTGAPHFHGSGNNPINRLIGLLRPHVPCLRVKDQNLNLAVCVWKNLLFIPNPNQYIFCLKLCDGIYGSGEVICNYQQLHKDTFLEYSKMKHQTFVHPMMWRASPNASGCTHFFIY